MLHIDYAQPACAVIGQKSLNERRIAVTADPEGVTNAVLN
jgi:hypothetical protein